MATVHALLYNSAEFTGIDGGELVSRLAQAARENYGRSGITLNTKTQSLRLGSDDGISLALIGNELISSVFKHAFPGERTGQITVLLTRDTGWATIAVLDDGVELGDKELGTGLSLVRALAGKLGGALTIAQQPEKNMTVRFPLKCENRPEGDIGECS